MSGPSSAALFVVSAFVSISGASARADDAPPPAAATPPTDAELKKQEADARAKAAAELVDAAKFCEKKSAHDEARRLYAHAMEFTPLDPALSADVARVKKLKDARRPAAAAQIEERRTKALAKCSEHLAPVALAYAQANRADDLERMHVLLRAVAAPPLDLDIAFFEPYLELRSKKDVERLTAGWEMVDGAWLEPAKVAELDKAHSDWADPWIVSDEFIEVRTNQTLRIAREALCKLAQTRRVFLGYFQGEWDLRPPATKLRVVVTGTRADLDIKVRLAGPEAINPPRDAVATYVDLPAAGNPVIACLEILDFKDKGTPLAFGWILRPLQREFVHQLAWEYSRHNAAPKRPVHAANWAIDGLADFMTYVELRQQVFMVRRPSWIPWCGKELDTSFNWCRSHYEVMPSMDELSRIPRPQFLKNPDHCRMASTLVWYLLEGKNRAYRQGFVKFLQTVHQNKDESDTPAACVKGFQSGLIDPEFRLFCREIRVEER